MEIEKFPSQFPHPTGSLPGINAPMNKNIQLAITWFVLAFLVTGSAVWQAQVAATREASARHRQLPPPLKTRRAERSSSHGVAANSTGDPVADYATRRAKGLTDREIGWIVEDFQSAGLDLGIRAASKEAYFAQRKAQDRWYQAALIEAWSLNPEQSAQVAAKLAELNDQAKADFIEALNAGPQPIEINGQWFILTSAEPIHRLIDANARLQGTAGAFLPWNLCKMAPGLRPDQSDKKIDIKITGAPGEPYRGMELAEPVHTISPAATSLITVDQFLPQPAAPTKEESIQVMPAEGDILAQLRKLHPAEVKLLLLIDPEKSREIRNALDASK